MRFGKCLRLREDELWDVSVCVYFMHLICNGRFAWCMGLCCPVVAISSCPSLQNSDDLKPENVCRVGCRPVASRHVSSVCLEWHNVFGKDHSERNEGPFCPSNCCWSCPPLLHLSGTLAVFQLHHLNAKQQVCFMSVTVQHSFVTLHAAFS